MQSPKRLYKYHYSDDEDLRRHRLALWRLGLHAVAYGWEMSFGQQLMAVHYNADPLDYRWLE